MNCKTKNKIYLLTYTGWQVRYVGQTWHYFNKHITNHHSIINNGPDRNSLQSKHFNGDFSCNPEQLSYKIIEKIIPNVYLTQKKKIRVRVWTEKHLEWKNSEQLLLMDSIVIAMVVIKQKSIKIMTTLLINSILFYPDQDVVVDVVVVENIKIHINHLI